MIEEKSIEIPIGNIKLAGEIVIPSEARGIVVFAHGSGSSRFSPRNMLTAAILVEAGLGTLLFDLLTVEEEAIDKYTAQFRFDIDLITSRLVDATEWLSKQEDFKDYKIGYFGASTGAAAAINAADRIPDIFALVSRGGRVDLANGNLEKLSVPSLFIVGELDELVIKLNKKALKKIPNKTEKKLEIVSGASHLFEEHGKLEEMTELAKEWFIKHL